ncbi:MAG: twin-arginine translocase TatA/TatE family subunit [Flavobacterium sp.]
MNFLTIFLELTPMHVMLIVVVVVLLFGGKKIPELMKGLGSGVKEFKKAAQQDDQPAVTKKEEETKE